jgi:predicted nucleotidyltransferase
VDAREIRALLAELGERLAREGLKGEMLVLGGTAMALVFNTLRRTKDIDAVFEPKARIYELAQQIADEKGLPPGWLNDAAKGFLSTAPPGERVVLDLPGLVVRVPSPAYLLAMKALAARPEDLEDIRLLVRVLRLHSVDDALNVIEKYYPRHHIPAKTQFFLEEILGRNSEP